MNTTGPNELGYASRAILSALIEELISNKLIMPDAASKVLDKAVTNLQSAGGHQAREGQR